MGESRSVFGQTRPSRGLSWSRSISLARVIAGLSRDHLSRRVSPVNVSFTESGSESRDHLSRLVSPVNVSFTKSGSESRDHLSRRVSEVNVSFTKSGSESRDHLSRRVSPVNVSFTKSGSESRDHGGVVVVDNLVYNVGFAEVVPTVGGERELVANRYIVNTRMISAFKMG